jgi:hypothetical protein
VLRNAAFDGFAGRGQIHGGTEWVGHFLRCRREEREMMLTELARRVEISIA